MITGPVGGHCQSLFNRLDDGSVVGPLRLSGIKYEIALSCRSFRCLPQCQLRALLSVITDTEFGSRHRSVRRSSSGRRGDGVDDFVLAVQDRQFEDGLMVIPEGPAAKFAGRRGALSVLGANPRADCTGEFALSRPLRREHDHRG